MDAIHKRIEDFNRRYGELKAEGLYFYLQPLEVIDGAWVACNGRRMLNFASYSYLGLLGHPWIDRAAREAIERYGTGTHGVRILAGTLALHRELEDTIARFTGREDAITFSSGGFFI